MTAQLVPSPVFKAFDNNGLPLFNGQLFTYAAGTTTPQATYTDSTQSTQNTNPVILNYRGEANVWLNPALAYKLVLEDALGNLIWTIDNVAGGTQFISGSFYTNQTFTATQGQTVFNLTIQPVTTASLLVAQNGSVLVPGTDYTINGSTLTLTNGATAGDTVYVAASTLALASNPLSPPATGPALTVSSATGWGAILAQSSIQVTGPNSLTNINQNVHQTQLLLHGYAAEFVSINGSAGADQKVWSNYADPSGNYNYRIENDALNATFTYCQVQRTGNSGTFGSHQPIVAWPIGYGQVTISSTINAGTYQLSVYAGNIAAFSNGLHIGAGTGTSDNALNIVNAANSAVFLNVRGDGKTVMGPALTANTVTLTVSGEAGSTAPVATFGGAASNFITVTDGAGMTMVFQTATGNAGIMGTSSNHAVEIIANNAAVINISAAGGLGFYGAASVAQPTTGVAAATFVQGAGNAVNDASTFDGYTLKQVVKAMRLEGLLA